MSATGRRALVAAEERPAYRLHAGGWSEAPGPVPTKVASAGAGLAAALATAEAGIAALAAVDLDAAGDRELLDAVVAQQRLADRPTAVQLRTLGAVDRRGCYGLDGAVTLASWYRNRTRLDPAEAARRVHAAARLPRFPQLAAALADGEVTAGQVVAVTEAAVPNRVDAIAACEPALVELARHTPPRDLKTALRRIAGQVDTDGTTAEPLPACGPDPRRELHIRPTIDGLHELRGLLDQLDAEALLTALDALDTPDPADTPPAQTRSPAQRRSDALGALARRALDGGTLPSVQGNRPHLLLTADLTHLLPAHLRSDPAALADRIATGATAEDLLGAPPDRPSAADPAATGGPGAARDTAGDPPPQRHLPQEPGRAADLRGGQGPRLRWTGSLPVHRARHLALQANLTAVLTLAPPTHADPLRPSAQLRALGRQLPGPPNPARHLAARRARHHPHRQADWLGAAAGPSSCITALHP